MPSSAIGETLGLTTRATGLQVQVYPRDIEYSSDSRRSTLAAECGDQSRQFMRNTCCVFTSTLSPPTSDCPPCFVIRALSDSRIMPAQVPHTGRPSETHCLRRGKMPHRSPISAIAVLSPPAVDIPGCPRACREDKHTGWLDFRCSRS